jgi:hypothetical protein
MASGNRAAAEADGSKGSLLLASDWKQGSIIGANAETERLSSLSEWRA